jgi:2-oxoglutarate ferredoxin oxidoreductase subunit beta
MQTEEAVNQQLWFEVQAMHKANEANEILTGLIYINEESKDLHQILNTNKTPLNQLTESELCPGIAKLEEINRGLS